MQRIYITSNWQKAWNILRRKNSLKLTKSTTEKKYEEYAVKMV